MKKRHINIPIFIPHMGCPNQCVFCNQRTISGVQNFDISSVRRTIEEQLFTVNEDDECEIAYFGGSFTGIERGLMISLLEIAYEYKSRGRIKSIRCSTRPDYISCEVLEILKDFGVDTIELGVQSASDSVLFASKRGHTFEKTKEAAELIREYGITLGGQMMIGLPGATPEDEVYTANMIASLGAAEARIYPTLVFRQTELCAMAECGVYKALTLDEAISRSALALEVLLRANIKLLRIGLCESEGLSSDANYHSGPYHPAMGELVFGEVYYNKILREIERLGIKRGASVELTVPRGESSKAVGHRGRNRQRLLDNYGIKIKKVNETLDGHYRVLVKECSTK